MQDNFPNIFDQRPTPEPDDSGHEGVLRDFEENQGSGKQALMAFKILQDEVRLRFLMEIDAEGRTKQGVTEIADQLRITQGSLSAHLLTLRNSGAIAFQKDEEKVGDKRERFYKKGPNHVLGTAFKILAVLSMDKKWMITPAEKPQ